MVERLSCEQMCEGGRLSFDFAGYPFCTCKAGFDNLKCKSDDRKDNSYSELELGSGESSGDTGWTIVKSIDDDEDLLYVNHDEEAVDAPDAADEKPDKYEDAISNSGYDDGDHDENGDGIPDDVDVDENNDDDDDDVEYDSSRTKDDKTSVVIIPEICKTCNKSGFTKENYSQGFKHISLKKLLLL